MQEKKRERKREREREREREIRTFKKRILTFKKGNIRIKLHYKNCNLNKLI